MGSEDGSLDEEIMAAQFTARTEVFVVRHAERLDEVPGYATVKNDRPWWDPPLTSNGVQQAMAAGEHMRAVHERRPFKSVFVSPCTRTIQTASHIAAALKLPPGVCAWAERMRSGHTQVQACEFRAVAGRSFVHQHQHS